MKKEFEKEKEVVEKIYKGIKDKKISASELDEIISKEMSNCFSFSEDYQEHYVKERIKDMIKKKKFNFLPATWTKRLLNAVLDYIFIQILFIFVVGNTDSLMLGIAISLLYYLISESSWSKTPAKFITKTKVITEYGEKPDPKIILIRTLLRCIPFEAFSFLGPQHPKGWHDRWSETIVVDDLANLKKED